MAAYSSSKFYQSGCCSFVGADTSAPKMMIMDTAWLAVSILLVQMLAVLVFHT